jgi:hypothetical protein
MAMIARWSALLVLHHAMEPFALSSAPIGDQSPRQSTAICERMSILIDRQMHSRETQVENRPLILRSERWFAI